MKIILLGYMGSGKSTIGRLIASKKNFLFIDLDNYIEEKENKTVAEIFEAKGEIYFRKKEHEYLKEILDLKQEIVLALGGGTPCYGNNMKDILDDKTAKTVYLKTSIDTIVARLTNENEKNQKNQRPLVARLKKEELHEFIAKHLFERSYFYNQSEYKITVDNKNVHEIIAELNKII